MNDPDLTLKTFFVYKDEDTPRTGTSAMESVTTISNLRKKFVDEVHDIQWPTAFSEIMKNLANLLDVGIPDIMTTAWNKYQLLRKYLDKDKYSPNKSILVSLTKHTVKSQHHPSIEVFVNEQLIGKVDFTVTVSLEFEGLILKIRDGRIMEITTGSCTGNGVVSCGDYTLIKRETAPFRLPGTVQLGGSGVPIVP
jgi:hypothetical protein